MLVAATLLPLGVIQKKVYRRLLSYGKRGPLDPILLGSTLLLILGLVYLLYSSRTAFTFGIGTLFIGWQLSVIGLTGGIAAGKSTAGKYIRDTLGYVLVDSDVIAREVVCRGTAGFDAIVKAFGPSVVDPETGNLDRAALGRLVFSDPIKKRLLESITHPRIMLRIFTAIVSNRLRGRRVIVDVPLLFEGNVLYYLCHECILIDATVEEQATRMQSRNPELTETDIRSRIQSQLGRVEKIKRADHVVNNSGTRESLYAQLDLILK